MSFPRFASYRDSGVEWLGEVPAHWITLPLKAVAIGPGTIFIDGDWIESKDISDDGIRYITTGNVGEGAYKEQGSAFITDETFAALNCTEVMPGDVLISRLNLPIGRACIVPELGSRIVTSVDNVIVRVGDTVVASYLTYLLSSKSYFAHAETLARGATMQRVSRTVLGNIRVCLPPLPEQHAIATFLDRETAKIDALVAEQQRLLDLMKERISAQVLSLRGSKLSTEMRIRHACEIIQRPVEQKPNEFYEPLGLFNRGRGLFHKDLRGAEDMGDSDFFWVDAGDLIISGQFAWEGAVAFAGEDETGCVVSHRYPVLRGKESVARTEYLFSYLLTQHGNFLLQENSRGSAGRNRPLNLGLLLNETVSIPDMELQNSVADAVHALSALQREVGVQRALLQEHRSALISAVVTGQIDVRGLVQAEAA